MPDIDADKDLEHRAIFGFQHGFSFYSGWFNKLFDDYILYPNLNILKQETRDLLFKKNMLGQLVPVFAKGLQITEIVKKLTNLDFLASQRKEPGIVEEISKIVLSEMEGLKTLESRIRAVEAALAEKSKYFCGLSYPISSRKYKDNRMPHFALLQPNLEGSLIAVEGILNHVDAVAEYDPLIGTRFKNSGVSWLLSDFPYFSMTAANPLYKQLVLGLSMEKEFERIISGANESMPFSRRVGWYPYVVVVGKYQSALSPSHPSIKVVNWAWMRLRLPKESNAVKPEFLNILDEKEPSNNAYQPLLRTNQDRDLFLLLSVIQLIYVSQNATYELAVPGIKELAKKVLGLTESKVTAELRNFYEPKDQSHK